MTGTRVLTYFIRGTHLARTADGEGHRERTGSDARDPRAVIEGTGNLELGYADV